ncbi:MAG: ABC transporter substrate-binding protein [Candidatus Thorarchaeota archaeon]
MLSSNTKRVLAMTMVAAFLLMAVSPLLVSAQTVPGHEKSGPYIDKIVFDVITQEDQRVIALQDGDIDLIDDQLDPSFLEALIEAENVEVFHKPRLGYGYVEINCAKYPLNITALRRAIAFALDKQAISDDVWEGLSQPLDSPVPPDNVFSIEGQLPYTYYEANVAYGNQLLDEAGFLDIDEDGFREAPDGSDFDILVECASVSNIAIESGEILEQALLALNIDGNSEATDFYDYLNRLYLHGDYDIVFLGTSFTTLDVNWLETNFGGIYLGEPYLNLPNFNNATFDSWIPQLTTGTTFEEVYEAAIEMQKILIYESPEIILYNNIQLYPYRTDKFDGWTESVIDGIPGFWTNHKVHLKPELGGPFGGTLVWSNSEDIDTFNHMAAGSGYTQQVLDGLFDQLIKVGPDGYDIPWLAESWTVETHDDNGAIPDGHMRITFDLIQNATWSDGTPLTAEDVAFTFNYYKDGAGNPYGPDLVNMVAAYAPTTYQVIIEYSSESYWNLHLAGYDEIIPKHVFESLDPDDWQQYQPDPPTTPMVTSGPFYVSEYIAGEFVELTRNPNYFYGLDRSATPTTPTTPGPGGTDLTLVLVVGGLGAAVVILIGGYVLMRNR